VIDYGLVAEWNFNNSLAASDPLLLGAPEGAEVIYLIEATVYDPALPGTKVLRYCSGAGFVYGGNYYEPRIKHPGRIRRMLFDEGKTSGPSQMGYGEVVLVNTDGGLDALATYGFDGRQLMIKRALAVGATLAGVVILAACGMEQAAFTWDEVAIRVKDRKQELNVPLQANKYGGTNALPAGVDGTADIQGRPKPLLFGYVKNATPVCVNTSRLIYQLHDGALEWISGVYDKGIPLAAGADYASQTDMEANAPVAGQYRAWPAGGMFRLGATPAAQVTADAYELTAAALVSAPKLAERIAARAIASGDINAADVAALHTANPAVVGYYSAAETTVASALDEVLGSIGGWYGFDAAGQLRCGRLDAPAGSPVATLTEAELLSIERLPTSDEGRGLPAWRVNLGYDRNWTPNMSDIAAWPAAQFSASNPLEYQTWRGAAHGAGLFVVVGEAKAFNGGINFYFTSPDGLTWTKRFFPTSGRRLFVRYLNGLFLVASSGTTEILTSADGVNWTARTAPISGAWRDAAYGNGVYVMANTGGPVITSTDALTWSAQSGPPSTPVVNWRYLTFGNGRFVLSHDTYYEPVTFYTSSDGITWSAPTIDPAAGLVPPEYFVGAVYDGFQWVGITSSGRLMMSADGTSWGYSGQLQGVLETKAIFPAFGGVMVVGTTAASDYGPSTYMHWLVDGIAFGRKEIPNASGLRAFVASDDQIVGPAYRDNIGENRIFFFDLRGPFARTTWMQSTGGGVTASDPAIQTIHPMARELNVDTLIVGQADAQAEANRLLTLHKADRVRLRVKVPRSRVPADVLGQPVQLQVPRYGWQAGKLLLVIGAEEDLAADLMWLDLWG